MNKWFISIIVQIILSLIHLQAGLSAPNPLPEEDIPQALLPALAPIETGNYSKIILISFLTVALLIFILLLFFYCHRRKVVSHSLSSFQQFIKDLHRAKVHVYTPDTKEFCSALCSALKSYLQREYQLPITCRTTEEFLKLFTRSSKFSWDTVSILSNVLQYSDQAKFAKQSFSSDLHKDLFLKTCRFVREVKHIRNQMKPKFSEQK